MVVISNFFSREHLKALPALINSSLFPFEPDFTRAICQWDPSRLIFSHNSHRLFKSTTTTNTGAKVFQVFQLDSAPAVLQHLAALKSSSTFRVCPQIYVPSDLLPLASISPGEGRARPWWRLAIRLRRSMASSDWHTVLCAPPFRKGARQQKVHQAETIRTVAFSCLRSEPLRRRLDIDHAQLFWV